MTNLAKYLTAGAALSGLIATPALADKAAQLVDINGSLGRDAEYTLQSRGFEHVSTNKNEMGYVYSYWWDKADDDCVQVEVYNGRVETITDATDQDCGHHKGDAAAAAVGVVAGAAILGALLSHKSNNHADGQHYSDQQRETVYERGYTDGLHNGRYRNPDASDAYAAGFKAGAAQRRANLGYQSGNGNQSRSAQISDLQGARAAGGMSALSQRGFRQVDNFTSGNARYSIQWRSASRQCVQVIIADGHFEDIRDIGQHPKCR